MLLTMLLLPVYSSLIVGLKGRTMGVKGSQFIIIGTLALSTLLSLIILYEVVMKGSTLTLRIGDWFDTGLIHVDWGFVVDPLGAWITSTVLLISLLVHVFASSYMATDPNPQRFLSLLTAFTAGMVCLVTGDTLSVLFVGWELIGVTSFLLIGFWWDRTAACNAASQAIVMNRFGDLSFTLAIILVITTTNTLDFSSLILIVNTYVSSMLDLFSIFSTLDTLGEVSVPSVTSTETNLFSSLLEVGEEKREQSLVFGLPTVRSGTQTIDYPSIYKDNVFINWVGILIVIAAFGKSAQFFLHTWLVRSMEGPTPVSALLHAATLVAGGTYLLLRGFALVNISSLALTIAAVIGTVTAIFAGTSALLQYDTKRIIAFSTASQFGYLTASIGLGQTNSTLFHLSSHSGFKALLFITAGGIIHATNDEQDIRKMGGLITSLPLTYTSMLIGSLSLIATPYLSGFFSKDLILEIALASNTWTSSFFWLVGSIAAGLTACYSTRLISYVFWGTPAASKKTIESIHEQPLGVVLPMVVLSFLAISFGSFSKEAIIGFGISDQSWFLSSQMLNKGYDSSNLIEAEFSLNFWGKNFPLICTIIGIGLGLLFFTKSPNILTLTPFTSNFKDFRSLNFHFCSLITKTNLLFFEKKKEEKKGGLFLLFSLFSTLLKVGEEKRLVSGLPLVGPETENKNRNKNRNKNWGKTMFIGLNNKWWIDHAYARALSWPTLNLSIKAINYIDKGFIELLGPLGYNSLFSKLSKFSLFTVLLLDLKLFSKTLTLKDIRVKDRHSIPDNGIYVIVFLISILSFSFLL